MPPTLETATPASGAVNVRADRLTLAFSEALDEASVARAFSIVPEWETPPDVRVSGRRIEVRFPDSLRANTTYVVGLDTNLRDLRNVALRQPITFAFATGPELDRGRIEGRVLDPLTNAPVAGLDVFAYALPDAATDSTARPDPRSDAPDYRTQTSASGTFALDYLRPALFFVVAVADANRNRRADPGEAFAAPFVPSVRAVAPDTLRADSTRLSPLRDSSLRASALRYFRTRLDTIPPAPLRIRTRSARRFAVRFDETVVLRDRSPEAWALRDTLTGQPAAVRAVYADDDPQQIVLVTDSLAGGYRLWLDQTTAVTDSAGNAARPDTLTFAASTDADTLRLRFLGFLPERGVPLRDDTAAVRFTTPPDSAALRRIAVTDSLGAALPFTLASRDGVRYRIEVDTDEPFRVAVTRPDSTVARTFTPLPADARGDLSGVVVADGRVVVEAVSGAARYTAVADATGTFLFPALPEGEYRLRAFLDRDGDGRWDGGRLAPYAPPEPILLLDTPQRVRPRWDTVVDTLRIAEPE